MTLEEQNLADEARQWVKKNHHILVNHFVNSKRFLPVSRPAAVFMAGSPGAGKTEFSKRIVAVFQDKIIRIDPDEIRNFLPGYTGKNAYIFQGAAAFGVEKVVDACFRTKYDFLLDGTMSDFIKSKANIERSIKTGRDVHIFYVYQDPKIAWEFTQKREELEKRNIPLDAFVYGFMQARNTVRQLKEFFQDKIQVHLVVKNYQNNIKEDFLNVDDIDNYLPLPYTESQIREML